MTGLRRTMSVAAVVAAAMVFGTTTATHAAVTFTLDDYAVTVNSTDPGLVIQQQELLGTPWVFDLELGQSTTVDLFEIWTDEGSVNWDDLTPKDISVAFSFSSPPPPFDGSSTGHTAGQWLFGAIQWGDVVWNSPLELPLGYLGDGMLKITLSNETFNEGLFGLSEGPGYGATVEATFTLLAEPTAIPEPASMLVWGSLGLLSVVAVTARRNKARRSRA